MEAIVSSENYVNRNPTTLAEPRLARYDSGKASSRRRSERDDASTRRSACGRCGNVEPGSHRLTTAPHPWMAISAHNADRASGAALPP
jgi:hypothetical protein